MMHFLPKKHCFWPKKALFLPKDLQKVRISWQILIRNKIVYVWATFRHPGWQTLVCPLSYKVLWSWDKIQYIGLHFLIQTFSTANIRFADCTTPNFSLFRQLLLFLSDCQRLFLRRSMWRDSQTFPTIFGKKKYCYKLRLQFSSQYGDWRNGELE